MIVRRVVPTGLVFLALAAVAPGAALAAGWTTESIPSGGVIGQNALVFDASGHGVLAWEGFDQQASQQKFTGIDVRDPAGGWTRGSNLQAITWGGAQIELYGSTRALLVSRQTAALGRFNRATFRLVYAYGRSDGTFGALRTLGQDVDGFASAANRAGDALVAYTDRRSGALRVVERRAGHGFGAARTLGTGEPGALAINARGDRVLAWWGRSGVYARVRRAGGGWGSTLLAARAPRVPNGNIRAAITPGGRVIVAWSAVDVREGHPVALDAGATVRTPHAGWHAFGLEHSTVPEGTLPEQVPAIPLVDSTGRTYATWTGAVDGRSAAKLAALSATGAGQPAILSDGVQGGAVDDAAAGPGGALAVSWSVPGPSSTVTYASLRPGTGDFDAPARLTPDGTHGLGGSRVAFQPVTGQALVAWGAVGPDGRGVLEASIGDR